MKKGTNKQKAHQSKRAQAGAKRQAQRKLHMKQVKVAMRQKEIAMLKQLQAGTVTL